MSYFTQIVYPHDPAALPGMSCTVYYLCFVRMCVYLLRIRVHIERLHCCKYVSDCEHHSQPASQHNAPLTNLIICSSLPLPVVSETDQTLLYIVTHCKHTTLRGTWYCICNVQTKKSKWVKLKRGPGKSGKDFYITRQYLGSVKEYGAEKSE